MIAKLNIILVGLLLTFTVTLFGFRSLYNVLSYTLLINAATGLSLMIALILSFKHKQTISVSILPILLIGITIGIYSILSPYNTTETLFKLLCGIQFYLLLSISSDKVQLYICLYWVIIVFGIYESIYALTLIKNSSLGLFGHFENQIGLGTLVAAILPYALYITTQKKRILKLIGITLSLFFFLTITLTKSRASIIAAAVSTVVFVLYYYRLQILKLKSLVKIAVIVSITITSIASAVYLYKIKENSANGRILIWSCSADMIKQMPIFGYGVNSFDANYMQHQAAYFEKNPNSQYAMLADNTRHPFNEYLLVIIEYGIIGFVIITFLCVCILASGFRFLSGETLPALLSVLSIAVISLFSYPLKYLSTIFLLIFALYIITNQSRRISIQKSYMVGLLMLIILCIGVSIHTMYRNVQFKERWRSAIAKNFESTKSKEIIQDAFDQKRYEYLYTYGALLNKSKRYSESILVMNQVMMFCLDSDVAVIQADNNYRIGSYVQAEQYALLASNMCPNKYLPLYYLAMIYNLTGRKDLSIHMAKKIICKPIKVHNSDVYRVKVLMQNLLPDKDSLPSR